MKRLGSIKNVMRDGSILLKTTESVKAGTAVFDARGTCLGKVIRVFGPVSEPYMVMKASDKKLNVAQLLDSSVYYDSSGVGGQERKRG